LIRSVVNQFRISSIPALPTSGGRFVRGALELSAGTTTLSATVLPVAGGVGRLVPGEVSDRVDRERAMAVSFLLCGAGVLAVTAGLSTSRTDSKTCEQYSSPITHI
jgi:nitrate/nitrite transporter NarK